MRRNNPGQTTFDLRVIIFSLVILAVIIMIFPGRPVAAVELVSDYTIQIQPKARVLGSLTGKLLVYLRPHITMYNDQGKQIFSRKMKNNVKPTLSPNGEYLGLITYADRSPTDLKTVKLEMFDNRGKFKWKLDKPAANAFHITDHGSFFGIEGVQGIGSTRVHVYDNYGDRRTILVFKNYQGFLASSSGAKFIIDQGATGLIVHDSLGEAIAVLPAAEKFLFDKDERYIGTFSGRIFRLYQDEKEVVAIRFEGTQIKTMAIDVAGDLVILMGEKRFGGYGLTTRHLKWDYTLSEKDRFFTSLDISPDSRRFACGVDVNLGNSVPKENRHIEGYIYLFSTNGSNLGRHKEEYSLWGVGFPKGVFSSSGGSLIVQTREKIEKLRLK